VGTGIPPNMVVLDHSLFKVKIAVAKLKSINHQVMNKLWQNWFKNEVKYYGLRSINPLNLFGIR
jgi:hypothetical protein